MVTELVSAHPFTGSHPGPEVPLKITVTTQPDAVAHDAGVAAVFIVIVTGVAGIPCESVIPARDGMVTHVAAVAGTTDVVMFVIVDPGDPLLKIFTTPCGLDEVMVSVVGVAMSAAIGSHATT